jgi:hypothetical protein
MMLFIYSLNDNNRKQRQKHEKFSSQHSNTQTTFIHTETKHRDAKRKAQESEK